jgi:hypothetical protein
LHVIERHVIFAWIWGVDGNCGNSEIERS